MAEYIFFRNLPEKEVLKINAKLDRPFDFYKMFGIKKTKDSLDVDKEGVWSSESQHESFMSAMEAFKDF